MQINGRTFVVSGGGSGLGAACVRMLAGGGGRVVIVDLHRGAAAQLCDEINATFAGDKPVAFFEADVADEAGVRRAVEFAATMGPLGGAICCAGIAPAARVVGKDGPHDLSLFERVVRVNLIGTFNVLRLTAEPLTKSPPTADGERGVIVCTASVAAFEGQIGQAAYAASKGGVAALTLPAARELAKHGIRIVTIAPGIFETPLVGGMSDEVRTSLAAQIPFPPRLGKPEEFASLVREAIGNVMLNGSVLRLDGAVRMTAK